MVAARGRPASGPCHRRRPAQPTHRQPATGRPSSAASPPVPKYRQVQRGTPVYGGPCPWHRPARGNLCGVVMRRPSEADLCSLGHPEVPSHSLGKELLRAGRIMALRGGGARHQHIVRVTWYGWYIFLLRTRRPGDGQYSASLSEAAERGRDRPRPHSPSRLTLAVPTEHTSPAPHGLRASIRARRSP